MEEKRKPMFSDQNIIVENRKRVNLSGVVEVVGFGDESIVLQTIMGKLIIKGENLKIVGFNSESGDLTATGNFCALAYTGTEKTGGVISRIFR